MGAPLFITGSPLSYAQVRVIKYPKLEELAGQVAGWMPNVVYVYGGVTGERAGLETQVLGRLELLYGAEGERREGAASAAERGARRTPNCRRRRLTRPLGCSAGQLLPEAVAAFSATFSSIPGLHSLYLDAHDCTAIGARGGRAGAF